MAQSSLYRRSHRGNPQIGILSSNITSQCAAWILNCDVLGMISSSDHTGFMSHFLMHVLHCQPVFVVVANLFFLWKRVQWMLSQVGGLLGFARCRVMRRMLLILLFWGANTCSDHTERITLQCTGKPGVYPDCSSSRTQRTVASLMRDYRQLLITYRCILSSARSYVHCSAWSGMCGRDNRNRTVFWWLSLRGALFSHLPSNDLDAILTPCTIHAAECLSVISQCWLEAEESLCKWGLKAEMA